MIKNRLYSMIVVMLMITTIFAFIPNVMAFDYTLEQNDVSSGLWPIDNPGECVAQSFVPTETFTLMEFEFFVEIYDYSGSLHGGVSSSLTDNENNWIGGYDTSYVDDNNDGWICFAPFGDVTCQAGSTYYLILKNPDSGNYLDSCVHGATDNPYSSGSAFSYYDGWEDMDANEDFGFKIRGDINSVPNAPTLISPSNGQTFTISEGETLDVDLTAVATDPDGDDITYRFWDDDTDDVIDTTGWKNSGESGTITWDNLDGGTYSWYARAGDGNGGGFGPKSSTWSFTIEEESDPVYYTLTIDASPSDGGTTDPSVETHSYLEGTVVDLEAFPNSGYSFDEWTGDKNTENNPTTITMSRDKSVTAHFSEDGPTYYSLTVTASPSEGGNVEVLNMDTGNFDIVEDSHTFDNLLEGTEFELVYCEDWENDWAFDKWTGDVDSNDEHDDPLTVIMDDDKSVTANFVLTGHNPPNEPSNPSPSDGAPQVSKSTDLGWSCSDPDGDSLVYDIYFGTSSNPGKVENDYTSKSYDPGDLVYGQKYYWKIIADDGEFTTSSSVWSFTVRDEPDDEPDYYFLHISDPHVTAYDAPDFKSAAIWSSIIDEIRGWSNPPKFIVLSMSPFW